MNLLALDTATENISATVYKDGNIFNRSLCAPQKHAEMILPMIDSLLKEASLDKKELDGIVLGIGPGSFTGVRIATSSAQGLALALDLKIATVTSLEAMAYEAFENNKDAPYFVSAIDARMGEVYLCIYKNEAGDLLKVTDEMVLKPEDAVKVVKDNIKDSDAVLCGTGAVILNNNGLNPDFKTAVLYPDAKYMLKKGIALFSDNNVCDPMDALPLYVRNEVTWKKVSEQ
ncbi:MAG: tRNA (adenosine(37)-N6)-threonylcarbamoyltransferase complex dimerization subunit type 1 TsaB [Succinivibrio sp.]